MKVVVRHNHLFIHLRFNKHIHCCSLACDAALGANRPDCNRSRSHRYTCCNPLRNCAPLHCVPPFVATTSTRWGFLALAWPQRTVLWRTVTNPPLGAKRLRSGTAGLSSYVDRILKGGRGRGQLCISCADAL